MHATNPISADSDSDGLQDGAEINVHGTNPNNADTDGDGLSDGAEIAAGSDPSDQAPSLVVSAPEAGSLYFDGETVQFEATATDAEDGDLTASVQWSSDVDGALGAGGELSLPLSNGAHEIMASVTDSANGTTTQVLSITINGIRGDINDDGDVNVTDLVLLKNHLVATEIIVDPNMLHRADVYPVTAGDGRLDVSDLLVLQGLLVNP